MQKLVVDTLVKFPNLLGTSGSLRSPRALKPMAPNGNRAVPHNNNKIMLESKSVPRQRGQISLGYYTNTEGKSKVQLPTNVTPKVENHPMLETKKLAWWYQTKPYLCHGRIVNGLWCQGKLWFGRGLNFRRWPCDTKANHASNAGQMLESCLAV